MDWRFESEGVWRTTIDGWRFRLTTEEGSSDFTLHPLGNAPETAGDRMYALVRCTSPDTAMTEAQKFVDRHGRARPGRRIHTIDED